MYAVLGLLQNNAIISLTITTIIAEWVSFMIEWAVGAVNDGCKVHFDAGAALLLAEGLRPRFMSRRSIRAILGQQSLPVLDEAKILFGTSNDAPTLKMALDYVRSKMSDQGQTFLLGGVKSISEK